MTTRNPELKHRWSSYRSCDHGNWSSITRWPDYRRKKHQLFDFNCATIFYDQTYIVQLSKISINPLRAQWDLTKRQENIDIYFSYADRSNIRSLKEPIIVFYWKKDKKTKFAVMKIPLCRSLISIII